MPPNSTDERVVLIAPVGQDAEVMADLLAKHGMVTVIFDGSHEVSRLINEGAGALVMTEEALELPFAAGLFEYLRQQPSWSELPLIILTSGGESQRVKLHQAAEAAGSMTLLERPIGMATLLRSVEVALRSRRRQYQARKLLEDKAHLAAIVESSEDAIISKDLNSIITSWNRGAERLFGYTADEAMGKAVTMLIPVERLDEEENIIDRIRRGKTLQHFETIRRSKDGRLIPISLTISPIIDPQGKIIGASKIARDITARRRTENQLAEAQANLREHATTLEKIVAERTQDLRATNEQLEAFVYSIAHDLRAPLRSMTGFSQLVLEDYGKVIGDAGQHLLKRIQTASEFMDRLLLDLLEYGRTARAQTEVAPVDVRKAWEAALFQCAEQIKRLKVVVETKGPLPTVLAHEATLGQCLANLLSNAVKFVSPGVQPRVRFWAEEHNGHVRVWLEDNGIGIAPDQHERVFRVFERLNGARYPGTGIGLSIVRKGIERVGGRVGLESEVGKGSRFWIELAKG